MSLREIGFELTNDCNLDCLHCLRDKDDTESFLPISLISRVLREAKAYGTQRVGFTGGEPTLHPDFLGVVDAVTKLGYPYFFVTNGLNFLRVFPRLCGGRNDRRKRFLIGISFSLDGAREETHDAVRGRGSFRRVIQAAIYLREKKVPFKLQMVVNSRNKGEIGGVVKLAHDLQAERVVIAPLQPTPQVIKQGLMLSPEEWNAISEYITEVRDRMKIEVQYAMGWYEPLSFFQCRFTMMESINIDYRGRLTFCCEISGMRGSRSKSDIVADLRKTGLHKGLQLLQEKIAKFNRDKLSIIGEGKMKEIDHFPCYYCSKYFGKIDWLVRRFPENPWAGRAP